LNIAFDFFKQILNEKRFKTLLYEKKTLLLFQYFDEMKEINHLCRIIFTKYFYTDNLISQMKSKLTDNQKHGNIRVVCQYF
jgi:hypothetical protein